MHITHMGTHTSGHTHTHAGFHMHRTVSLLLMHAHTHPKTCTYGQKYTHIPLLPAKLGEFVNAVNSFKKCCNRST